MNTKRRSTLTGRFIAALTEEGPRGVPATTSAIARRLDRVMEFNSECCPYGSPRYTRFAYGFLLRPEVEKRHSDIFNTRHGAHAALRSLAAGKEVESKDIALVLAYARLWEEFLSTLGSRKPLAA